MKVIDEILLYTTNSDVIFIYICVSCFPFVKSRDGFDRTRIDERKTLWQFDKFGVEKLYPSFQGGREFYLPDDLPTLKVNAVKRIGNTEMVVLGYTAP